VELLHVSAFKPHELLQQLVNPPGGFPTSNNHHAQWFDQTARLYRFFEFVHTNSRAAGVAAGGRLPGQVNINTVWDVEIFQALCDAYLTEPIPDNAANQFSINDVQSMFERLLQSRRGLPPGSPQLPYVLGSDDRPFLGLGVGHSPGGTIQHPTRGMGINDSLFRAGLLDADTKGPEGGWNPTAEQFPRLFQKTFAGLDTPVTGDVPYFMNQMLGKLFNNITTRSNVFGIWVTVGFFQVTDDTVRPVKLGAEIGKAEARNIRHRMFAIVDRSNLTVGQDSNGTVIPGRAPIILSGSVFQRELTSNPTAPLRFTVEGAEYDASQNRLFGYYEGIPWEIRGPSAQGQPTQVRIDYGTNRSSPPSSMELLRVVKRVNPPGLPNEPATFQVDLPGDPPPFTQPNTTPFYLEIVDNNGFPRLGNPGPQKRFNPRDYPWIVRYMSIIQ
jgi:hypothetical protein